MSARDSAACNRDWRECVDPRCGEGVCIQSGAREFDQSAADKRNKVKVADVASVRERPQSWEYGPDPCMCETVEEGWRPCPPSLCERTDHHHAA